jgi:hypothetical protein
VNRALSLYPSAITIGSSQSQTFLPSYGAPPYTFAVIGSGTITSAGIYTAPTGTGGPYTVQVTDSKNNTTTSAVTVAAFGVFSGISTIDSVSGTSVRLNWAPSATAATYTVYRMNGATQVFVATTNAPASNYTVTGLSPLTAYTFRVRMTDTQGTTDTNMQDVGTTTSGVTLTHSGWSNVKSVGAITPVSQSGLSSANAYATITWNAMIPSEGTITSYNIYRATSSGGQNFASPLATGISAATRTYTDSTVSGSTTYYYVVRALINSVEVAPTIGTHPNEIKIISPPANMVLIHRWIANQEMCGLLQSATDPANNYRCAYTGLGGTGTHFDTLKSFFVGRYEMGCNYTPPNATAALSCGDSTNGCLGVANPSGSVTGNRDDVYYDRSTGSCYINTSIPSGTVWTNSNASALTSAQRAILASNKPGLPPLVRIDQPRSWETCQAFTDPTFGTKRLLTHKEQILAGAWSSSLTDTTISSLEAGTAANGCNSNAASGLTYDANATPANLETLPGNTASGIKSVRTGGNITSSCESRYGAMDMTGNVWEWSSDQLGTCTGGTTNTCTGTSSNLDTSNTDWNNFPFDGTQGPGGSATALTNWAFSSMTYSSTRFLVPLGLPMVTGASASYGSLAIGTSAGQFDPAKFHSNRFYLETGNSNGTPARGARAGGSWGDGLNSGRFTVVLFSTPAATGTSIGLRCFVPSE